jgi:hypothetical protein
MMTLIATFPTPVYSLLLDGDLLSRRAKSFLRLPDLADVGISRLCSLTLVLLIILGNEALRNMTYLRDLLKFVDHDGVIELFSTFFSYDLFLSARDAIIERRPRHGEDGSQGELFLSLLQFGHVSRGLKLQGYPGIFSQELERLRFDDGSADRKSAEFTYRRASALYRLIAITTKSDNSGPTSTRMAEVPQRTRSESGFTPRFRPREIRRAHSATPRKPESIEFEFQRSEPEREPKSQVVPLKRFFTDPPPFVENDHWNAIQAVCHSPATAAEMTEFIALAQEILSMRSPFLREARIFAIRFLGKMIVHGPRIVLEFDRNIKIFQWTPGLLAEFPNCTALHREIRRLLKIALPQPPIGAKLVMELAPFCLAQVALIEQGVERGTGKADAGRLVQNQRKGQGGNPALRAAVFAFLKAIVRAARARPQVYRPVLQQWPEFDSVVEGTYREYWKKYRAPYGGNEIQQPISTAIIR